MVLLGILILGFGAGFFTRKVAQLPQHAWAGPRTSAQKQRGPSGQQRPLRHELKLINAKARSADWLEQRRHDRKNSTGHAATPGATATAAAPGGNRSVVTPIARARQAMHARRAARASNAATTGTVIPPAVQSRPSPPPQRPPAAPSASSPSNGSPGRNTTMAASGNAVEQFVEGVNQIHAQAQAGGIHAKHAAVKACHEACVRFAAMAAMLSRQMSEPGMNYGNEITEPIAKSATQLQASAMTFSEADSALTTLENMTVGELAASSRQAPHHQELSENGSQ